MLQVWHILDYCCLYTIVPTAHKVFTPIEGKHKAMYNGSMKSSGQKQLQVYCMHAAFCTLSYHTLLWISMTVHNIAFVHSTYS